MPHGGSEAVNEEEIKIKLVLPWLAQAGVDRQELQFERTFSVRIGRQTIPIGGSSTRDSAGGRLDILVRRHERNLLIVETKAEGVSLTDDDRDQAISYARLVHPIAPYAVVTNGSEYRLYDSITKKQIEPSDIKISGYPIALPETDIAEAQTLFLALNRSNLSLFCQHQVAGELLIIRGALTDARKYVPDLHVSREAIVKEVQEFYRSDLPGLLLVGESGSGKTCELCSIAESLLARGSPVLFFNGVSLEKDIIDAIAREFFWTFNGSEAPIHAVKRIESCVREDFLTIIVDAIDEWMYQPRANNLAALLRAADKRKIKVVVSCKTSSVEQFLSARGMPMATSQLVKRVDVTSLSHQEFFQALDKYRCAYNFFGGFEDAVLEQARTNPFLLRVLFDVARGSNVKHLTFSSSRFFEEYYKRCISKTKDRRQAEDTLEAIALLLYERNTDWLYEHEVRALLDLRVSESLMEELFEYGILLRSLVEGGEPAIGFYFQQLRDYVVAFKARRFSNMSALSLEEEFKRVTFPSMRGDVFILYYRLASREHRHLFDSELRANAARYVRCYVSLIDENFPKLKNVFEPGTSGGVGFIGELDLSRRMVRGYGFRPLADTDDEVYFIPVQKPFGDSNLAYLDGASELHARSSANGFREIDITREVVEGELLPQIRRLIEKGGLNESNNRDMLIEHIVELVLHNEQMFRALFTTGQNSVRYPLKLDAIVECLLREKLVRHYRDQIIERKRRSREISEVWNGSLVSYSYSTTPEDEAEVNKNVETALLGGEAPVIRVRYRDLQDLEGSLEVAINALRWNGSEIAGPLFEASLQTGLVRGALGSGDGLKMYLRDLYSAFLSNYKVLVETNFPTLRSYFTLYSKLPVSIYLVVGPSVISECRRGSTQLGVYMVKACSEKSAVQVVDEVASERSERGMKCTIGGVVHEQFSCHMTTVENLFAGHPALAYDRFHGMTLRKLVYSTLLEELAVVEKAFRGRAASGKKLLGQSEN